MYKFDKNDTARKHYVLEMFSYPSGAKLHVGHWYNYALSDSYARFKKMQGFNVFEPMGFDSFGLPAENYAIKTGIHPQDSTLKNIEIMEEQLKNMGAMFDWDAEVKTCMPDYYKWTQWMFLKLYEKGLAYRKEAPVNWCPSCNTVLANEQVSDGECERCHSTVVKKNLTQWFFKITDYAQELLDGLNALDWPEKTKLMQKNWIGRSEGGEIEFVVDNADKDAFRVFTTRADTLFGVTYVVLAPEHPLVDKITAPDRRQAVEEYRLETSKVNEIERLSTAKEKTGVFTGAYAFNPINGDRVPILIGDYVLYSYGTGCVMGVPAHDERDFVFAQKHGLPIKRVVCGAEGKDDLPFTEYGVMTNSGEFDGMTSEEGRRAVVEKLARKNKGELKVNYRLRDWLVSRSLLRKMRYGARTGKGAARAVALRRGFSSRRRKSSQKAQGLYEYDLPPLRRQSRARSGHAGHLCVQQLVFFEIRGQQKRQSALRQGDGKQNFTRRQIYRRRGARLYAPVVREVFHQSAKGHGLPQF